MPRINDEHRLLENRNSGIKLPSITLTHLKNRRKKISRIFTAIVLIILITASIFGSWLFISMQPVDPKSNEAVLVEIESGQTQRQIAAKLEKAGVIRNSLIFNIYTLITGNQNTLKTGIYKIFKHDDLKSIVGKLVSGRGTEISIMFLPGATIMDNKELLMKNGFTDSEIQYAFEDKYTDKLTSLRPTENDIEGFIYGDTYNFASQASLSTILSRTFTELQKVVDENDLNNKFESQGLSLYEGIILSSIVQSEVTSPSGKIPSEDQRIVAGIFYNRLRIGMLLGSDVTYQYIADKLGMQRDTKLDNPYNTRRYAGLPPGPISSPGITALLATANPASTDYYFFLSGDDNKMHYALDNIGHQQNISLYCKIKCSTL